MAETTAAGKPERPGRKRPRRRAWRLRFLLRLARELQRPDRDGGYHLLFSHVRMVVDLLSGFIDEPWVADLDLDTLERVNAKLHGSNLLRADGDMIWRVRRRSDGGYAYLYVMVEFQSRPDRWMAVRMGAAVLLVYLHLIREENRDRRRSKKQEAGDGQEAGIGHEEREARVSVLQNGRLPPVFPLVLYTGKGKWHAAQDVAERIADIQGPGSDPDYWRWRPSIRYHVLSEFGVTGDRLGMPDNVVAVLFALERCQTLEEVRVQVRRLAALLQDDETAPLRRALETWITGVLAVTSHLAIGPAEVEELSERGTMLKDVFMAIDREIDEKLKAASQAAARSFEDGKTIGFDEGQTKGRAQTLLRLLRRRFAPLPSRFEAMVLAAKVEQLDEWTDSILDARTLEDVFGRDCLQ